MFIGHLGAGLALKKIDNKSNLSWLFGSVMLLDILLWIFVLLGIEEASIPDNYAQLHYLKFFFPYSHGLLASVIWTSLTFLIARFAFKRKSKAIALTVGVFSHFILDYLVHPPEIPLTGQHSKQIGLGLWNNMHLALILEFIILVLGLAVYFSETRGKTFIAKFGMIIFMALLVIIAFAGQLFSPAPASISQVAGSSLVIILLVAGIAYWLDKKREPINHKHHARAYKKN